MKIDGGKIKCKPHQKKDMKELAAMKQYYEKNPPRWTLPVNNGELWEEYKQRVLSGALEKAKLEIPPIKELLKMGYSWIDIRS